MFSYSSWNKTNFNRNEKIIFNQYVSLNQLTWYRAISVFTNLNKETYTLIDVLVNSILLKRCTNEYSRWIAFYIQKMATKLVDFGFIRLLIIINCYLSFVYL